jgi:hypothetical protein
VEAILPWLSIDIPQGMCAITCGKNHFFPAGLPMDEETLEIDRLLPESFWQK